MIKLILVPAVIMLSGMAVGAFVMIALGFRLPADVPTGAESSTETIQSGVAQTASRPANSETSSPDPTPNPRQTFAPVPNFGSWERLPDKVSKTLVDLGFSRAKEWRWDSSSPTSWVITLYGPAPPRDQRDSKAVQGQTVEPLRPEWRHVTISTELAQIVLGVGDFDGLNYSLLWPLYKETHSNDYLMYRGTILIMIYAYAWRRSGLPGEVVNWLIENEAIEAPHGSVWNLLQQSRATIPEGVLKQVIRADIEHLRAMPKGSPQPDNDMGFAGLVFKRQYPDSDWLNQFPEVMSEIERLEKEDR